MNFQNKAKIFGVTISDYARFKKSEHAKGVLWKKTLMIEFRN